MLISIQAALPIFTGYTRLYYILNANCSVKSQVNNTPEMLNRFLTELRPLFIMGTIFGTHPLRWNNFSLEFKLISWETAYFTMINAVQLYITFGYTYFGIQVCKCMVQQK